jgi:hypothetical protein
MLFRSLRHCHWGFVCVVLALALVAATLRACVADEAAGPVASRTRSPIPDRTLLTPNEWQRLNKAVDRGLRFLSASQRSDGSFPTTDEGQPGVTSLCIMAMLSRGHQPGKGPYGSQINRAIDYVLNMQNPNGAIMADRWVGPSFDAIRRNSDGRMRSFPGNYSHGISGVMLGEVFGITDSPRNERIRGAILKALDYTRRLQTRPKAMPEDRGGWRYVHRETTDSDLSITAWQLMFLRSARNAEFNVPAQWITEAMGYVHRTFDVEQKAFVYAISGPERYCSRGMVGAGIVCLELGGEHRSPTGKEAGNWVLRQSFDVYNRSYSHDDRYHYGAFYCSQAMFQLGGEYWHKFFPKLLKALAEAQHADGSWDAENSSDDDVYGNAYTTALAVLALATPYQLLPIYQR